jgi:hypothetical protein
MPEQLGHPVVSRPGGSRIVLLDVNSEDGPGGSIRLRVRDPNLSQADDTDLDRYWIRPDRNFLCLQSETVVFDSTDPTRIVSTESCTVESVAKSPHGYWYPTRVRRKTSNFAIEQITAFHLDFDAEIPDELFEPLKLNQ